MNRTALRLATLAALTNGGVEPWPTLAGDYVYDSRRDALQDVTERMRRPVIVIRTDDDMRSNQGPNGAYTERQTRVCDLLLEISVVSARKEKDQDGNETWVVGWAQTDPAAEATLDMLEFQIENALFGNSTWAHWWSKSRDWQFMSYGSRPEFSRDPHTLRLAARTITFSMGLPRTCLPGWRYEDEPEKLATMPSPLLTVIEKIRAQGGGDLLIAANQIAAILNGIGWPNEAAYPQLTSVMTQITVGKAAL